MKIGKLNRKKVKKLHKKFVSDMEERKGRKTGFRFEKLDDGNDYRLLFGLWKGQTVRRMAIEWEGRRYLSWVLNSGDCPEELLDEIQDIINEVVGYS